ncbi:MAG: hypothetical protein ABGZ53_20300 [Fuerstiella sp.]
MSPFSGRELATGQVDLGVGYQLPFFIEYRDRLTRGGRPRNGDQLSLADQGPTAETISDQVDNIDARPI